MKNNKNLIIGLLVGALVLVLAFWAGQEYEEEETVGEKIEETFDRAGDQVEDGLEETGDNLEEALDRH